MRGGQGGRSLDLTGGAMQRGGEVGCTVRPPERWPTSTARTKKVLLAWGRTDVTIYKVTTRLLLEEREKHAT